MKIFSEPIVAVAALEGRGSGTLIERLLIKRILSGDPNAAERLIREHYPRILRFTRHLTGSKTEAEDLTQQTFLKAKEALPRFRHDSSISTWLHRIAYREFTHLIRDRRETTGDLPESSACHTGRSEDAVILNAAIAELPQDIREAFVLREIQELSVREVATILDIPEGTVKSRNHTARERLKQRLAGTWEATEDANSIGGQREAI